MDLTIRSICWYSCVDWGLALLVHFGFLAKEHHAKMSVLEGAERLFPKRAEQAHHSSSNRKYPWYFWIPYASKSTLSKYTQSSCSISSYKFNLSLPMIGLKASTMRSFSSGDNILGLSILKFDSNLVFLKSNAPSPLPNTIYSMKNILNVLFMPLFGYAFRGAICPAQWGSLSENPI